MTNKYNTHDSYVPALRDERTIVIGELLPPEPTNLAAMDVTPASQTVIHQRDTELTRAQATTLFSLPLAVGLGLVTTAAVLTLTSTPILSAATLIVFFVTFAGVWAGAFVYHVSRSPAGTAYMHTKSMWRVIEREQQHRHEAYWYHTEKDKRQ